MRQTGFSGRRAPLPFVAGSSPRPPSDEGKERCGLPVEARLRRRRRPGPSAKPGRVEEETPLLSGSPPGRVAPFACHGCEEHRHARCQAAAERCGPPPSGGRCSRGPFPPGSNPNGQSGIPPETPNQPSRNSTPPDEFSGSRVPDGHEITRKPRFFSTVPPPPNSVTKGILFIARSARGQPRIIPHPDSWKKSSGRAAWRSSHSSRTPEWRGPLPGGAGAGRGARRTRRPRGGRVTNSGAARPTDTGKESPRRSEDPALATPWSWVRLGSMESLVRLVTWRRGDSASALEAEKAPAWAGQPPAPGGPERDGGGCSTSIHAVPFRRLSRADGVADQLADLRWRANQSRYRS